MSNPKCFAEALPVFRNILHGTSVDKLTDHTLFGSTKFGETHC
jgi:hypothetical protein